MRPRALCRRRMTYKWHPQPTSLKIATIVAKKASMRGQRVLDPFCGTGACLIAAVRARAKEIVGSDLEDWSEYLRPELRTMLECGSPVVRVYWGLDAMEAVRRFEHDILFTDPPNPWAICGGCWVTVLRDLGLTFYDLRRYWLSKLRPDNLMGKGSKAVSYLMRLVKHELDAGRRVIINLFSAYGDVASTTSRQDLARIFKSLFIIKRVHGNFYRVMALKNGGVLARGP